MKLVKKTKNLLIYKKRNGRYCVMRRKQSINGAEKVEILAQEGLITQKPAANKKSSSEDANSADKDEQNNDTIMETAAET
jgi:hypothetical protein